MNGNSGSNNCQSKIVPRPSPKVSLPSPMQLFVRKRTPLASFPGLALLQFLIKNWRPGNEAIRRCCACTGLYQTLATATAGCVKWTINFVVETRLC